MSADDHYTRRVIAMPKAVWGTGFLSPGALDEVARILDGQDISGI